MIIKSFLKLVRNDYHNNMYVTIYSICVFFYITLYLHVDETVHVKLRESTGFEKYLVYFVNLIIEDPSCYSCEIMCKSNLL